ncbi:hypothetical protein TNCV_1478601 [Trichonephila clavipes]|nr:hypothetical protein TNCV_1478601 [Trichonephila clavipes]
MVTSPSATDDPHVEELRHVKSVKLKVLTLEWHNCRKSEVPAQCNVNKKSKQHGGYWDVGPLNLGPNQVTRWTAEMAPNLLASTSKLGL